MARLLVASRSMALALRLADAHEIIEHPVDGITEVEDLSEIDVVVLDLGDPRESMRAIGVLRERGDETPVLVVPGYQPEWASVLPDQRPGLLIVSLPITRAALLHGIAHLLGAAVPGAVAPLDQAGPPPPLAMPQPPAGRQPAPVQSPAPSWPAGAPPLPDARRDLSPPMGVPASGRLQQPPAPTLSAPEPAVDGHAPASGAVIDRGPVSEPVADQVHDEADAEPEDTAPGDSAPIDSEQSDLEPSGVEPSDVEPSDVGPSVGDRPGEESPVAEQDAVAPEDEGSEEDKTPEDEAPEDEEPVDETVDDEAPTSADLSPVVDYVSSDEDDPELSSEAGFVPPPPVRLEPTPAAALEDPFPVAPPAPRSTGPIDLPSVSEVFPPAHFPGSREVAQAPVQARRRPLLNLKRSSRGTNGAPAPTPGEGLRTSGPGTGPVPMVGDRVEFPPPTDDHGIDDATLVRLVHDRLERLFGVVDTAQALADDVIERADADAAAILVPDGAQWRVAAGVGLRPLERRLILDSTHWLVNEVVVGGKALLVEDTDIVRQKLAGAPLAAWRHLMGVPVPDVRAAVVLARGQDAGPFTEHDLTSVVPPVREAAGLLAQALEVRRLARRLDPLRELDDRAPMRRLQYE